MSGLRQVLVQREPGQLEALALEDAPRRPPGPGEVEVEVEAVALNFKDVLLALGLLPVASVEGLGLGFECAGRVVRVGAGVLGLAPGDEVLGLGAGCLASSLCLPAETVRPRPRRISALDAVTLPVAFVTATYALEELARLRLGERVLVHAATGGVGLAALQIARVIGAQIFTTAGSEEKRSFLRGMGVEHVMDSRTPAFAEEVLERTDGVGVDVVLNSLSGDLLERSLAVLAPHGRFIELGARDAVEGRALSLSVFARGASFCALGYLGALPRLGSRLSEVLSRAEIGEFKPLPRRSYPVSELGEALSLLARARHIGKVVVLFGGGEGEVDPPEAPDPTRDYLLPSEGVELFELCLAAGRPRAVVSKTPLTHRLSRGAPLVAAPHASPSPQAPASPSARARRHPRPPLATPFKAPRGPIEAKIAEIWSNALRIEPVGVDDDLFALGGDSLLAVQLAHQLRAALGVELPAHLLLEHPSVAALAARLGQSGGGERSPHLVRLAEGPAGTPPLFLVHPIGGHVYFYLPIARGLADAVPVWGLQARGVDGEASPATRVDEMAAAYVAAIRSVQPEGPYRLGGSSFGGVVAHEIACQLAQQGQSVSLLALIDSPGPGALPAGFQRDAEILAYLLSRGEADTPHLRALSTMSHDEMLAYFLRHGGAVERLSPDATIEGVRHFLTLFRVNFDALVAWQPRHWSGTGLFFRATEPDGFNPPGLERAWAPYFRELELWPVPGNHTTMNQAPHVDVIIEHLRARLVHPRSAS